MTPVEIGLFGFGYPASIAVLSRFLLVVRERRWRWLAVHHLGVAAIVAGWLSRGRPSAAAPNSAWLLASTAWYVLAGRRRDRAGAAASSS